MSRRTGIAVETLSLLDYAADQTGTSLETVEVAVRRMQKSVAGVADETEGTTGKLDFLGLTAEKLAGLNVDQQFAAIAAALRSIDDPTQRAAAAMKVFGVSSSGGRALIRVSTRWDRWRARRRPRAAPAP
jgi:hypothetical protein